MCSRCAAYLPPFAKPLPRLARGSKAHPHTGTPFLFLSGREKRGRGGHASPSGNGGDVERESRRPPMPPVLLSADASPMSHKSASATLKGRPFSSLADRPCSLFFSSCARVFISPVGFLLSLFEVFTGDDLYEPFVCCRRFLFLPLVLAFQSRWWRFFFICASLFWVWFNDLVGSPLSRAVRALTSVAPLLFRSRRTCDAVACEVERVA